MLLRYALTHEARLHLAEYKAAQQNAMSNEKYIMYVMLFIGGLLLLIAGLLIPGFLLHGLIASQIVMWFSAVPLLSRKSHSRLRRKAIQQTKQDPFEYITTRTLELQPGGLSLITPFGSRYFHNTQLRICDQQNKGYAYIWLLGDEMICVPEATVFEGDFHEFITGLQERIDARDWVTSFRSMLDQSTFLPNPAKIELDVTLRPFDLERDLEGCLALYQSNQDDLPQGHIASYKEFLREASQLYVVMELGGQVIGGGGLLWDQEAGTVQLVYGMIHKEQQDKGLGGLLLMYRLAMLREASHEQVLGITMEASPQTAGFYLRFGFYIIGHQHHRYEEGKTMLNLWKYFYPEEILTIHELVKSYQPPVL